MGRWGDGRLGVGEQKDVTKTELRTADATHASLLRLLPDGELVFSGASSKTGWFENIMYSQSVPVMELTVSFIRVCSRNGAKVWGIHQ